MGIFLIEHGANLAKNKPVYQVLYFFCSGLKLKGVAKSCQGVASALPRHTLNEALQCSAIVQCNENIELMEAY